MKKLSAFVLSLFVLAFVGLYAQETYVLKIKAQTANVRSEPDGNSTVIKQVKLGTLFESRQKIGDWFEITVMNDKGEPVSGYVNANVVDVISGGEKQEVVKEEPQVRQPAPKLEPLAMEQESVPSTGGVKIMGAFSSANMTYTLKQPQFDIDKYKKPRTGFGGGLGFEMGATIGFEIDLLYLQKGMSFKGSESGADFDLKFNFDEVSVPVLLKFHILNKTGSPDVYLLGGGEIAYVMQSKIKYKINAPAYGVNQSGTEDVKKNTNKIDYGAVLGGGVCLPVGGLKLFVEGRYHLGMANMEKTTSGYEGWAPEDASPKTNALLILAGLKF
jgi:hypothetical protein